MYATDQKQQIVICYSDNTEGFVKHNAFIHAQRNYLIIFLHQGRKLSNFMH